MDKEVAEALQQFFSAQKKLHRLGVIRSRDYIGDIGRHLCQVMYHMEPAARRAGHDGTIGTSRIKVVINNCPTGTPVRVSEPMEWNELIVVLGPNCFLRPEGVREEFIFYRFTKEEVLESFKTPGGRYIGRKSLFCEGHDRVLGLASAAARGG